MEFSTEHMDFFTFRPERESAHISGEKTPKFAFVPTDYVFICKKGVKYCPGKRVPQEKKTLILSRKINDERLQDDFFSRINGASAEAEEIKLR
jgi:hypothetical protein